MVRKYLFFITSKRAVLWQFWKKFELSFVYLQANKAIYAKEIYLTEFFLVRTYINSIRILVQLPPFPMTVLFSIYTTYCLVRCLFVTEIIKQEMFVHFKCFNACTFSFTLHATHSKKSRHPRFYAVKRLEYVDLNRDNK